MKYSNEITNAVFLAFIFGVLLACLYIVYDNLEPIILGSELNTNGRVEYLCLGAGCENL